MHPERKGNKNVKSFCYLEKSVQACIFCLTKIRFFFKFKSIRGNRQKKRLYKFQKFISGQLKGTSNY